MRTKKDVYKRQVYGRMIEIYLTVSLAPIPFSTMANREWGQMGTNYLRSLFALGFQGFLILVCVATVSYTHLDVYKRQVSACARSTIMMKSGC